MIRQATPKDRGLLKKAIEQGRERWIFASSEQKDRLPKTKSFNRRTQMRLRCSQYTPQHEYLKQIGVLVRAHRADDTLGKAVAKIVRAELIVIDDVGLLLVGTDAAEGRYRIVEAAYERKSVAVSSNLHPSGFDELMPKTLATATVDRLLHHAHLCQTSGDSVRLAQALHGQGVKALT